MKEKVLPDPVGAQARMSRPCGFFRQYREQTRIK